MSTPFIAPTKGRISGPLVRHRDESEEYDVTLADCPYYRRGQPGADPKGTCSHGCWTEPSCKTDEPTNGWHDRTYRVWPRHHQRTVVNIARRSE